MTKRLMAGDTAPKTALYNIIEADGIIVGQKIVNKGKRLPPTESASQYYEDSEHPDNMI